MSKFIQTTIVDNEFRHEVVESDVRLMDGKVWITSELAEFKVKEAVKAERKKWQRNRQPI